MTQAIKIRFATSSNIYSLLLKKINDALQNIQNSLMPIPVVKVVRALPFRLHTDSHFSLSRKLFEFPSQPLYTNGRHSPRLLLKCHLILKLEQFPSARGSSQKSAVVGMAVKNIRK